MATANAGGWDAPTYSPGWPANQYLWGNSSKMPPSAYQANPLKHPNASPWAQAYSPPPTTHQDTANTKPRPHGHPEAIHYPGDWNVALPATPPSTKPRNHGHPMLRSPLESVKAALDKVSDRFVWITENLQKDNGKLQSQVDQLEADKKRLEKRVKELEGVVRLRDELDDLQRERRQAKKAMDYGLGDGEGKTADYFNQCWDPNALRRCRA